MPPKPYTVWLKNCKNIGIHSGPCKYSGWYCDAFCFCEKFRFEVPFNPPLVGGMGSTKSIFPEQCKYHEAIFMSAQEVITFAP